MLKSSFPPHARADARVLICGSLPGDRSLAEQRYYAHPRNQFWRLLSPVLGRDLAALAYPDRLAALLDARVALWDVVAIAHRRGSGDAEIADASPNDVAALAATLPQLRAVAFNGGKALAIGRPLVAALPVAAVALPSSSPLHTVGLAAKQPAWSALARWLGDFPPPT